MRKILLISMLTLALAVACSSTKPKFFADDQYGNAEYYIKEDGTEYITAHCFRWMSPNRTSNYRWEDMVMNTLLKLSVRLIKKAHPELRRSKNLRHCISVNIKGKNIHLTTKDNRTVIMRCLIEDEEMKKIIQCAKY